MSTYVNKATEAIIIANRDLAPIQDIANYPAFLPDGRHLRVNYYSFCQHTVFTGHTRLIPDNNNNHASFKVIHGTPCKNQNCINEYYRKLYEGDY